MHNHKNKMKRITMLCAAIFLMHSAAGSAEQIELVVTERVEESEVCATAADAPQSLREQLITEAKKHVGAPYRLGAMGPERFDCSGFVLYSAQNSIQRQLPRTARAIYKSVCIIADENRMPGDLVFFRTSGDAAISHVGIYLGDGQFISAASAGPKTGVIISSLQERYWKKTYAGSGRFIHEAESVTEKGER